MTIVDYFLQTLQEVQEINCLRSWAWDNGLDYKWTHRALKRAKELYPGKVHVTRQADQQGRPLIVKWIS